MELVLHPKSHSTLDGNRIDLDWLIAIAFLYQAHPNLLFVEMVDFQKSPSFCLFLIPLPVLTLSLARIGFLATFARPKTSQLATLA